MSARPPPPEALLLDYAAGAAGPSLGLLMATHLAMSKESRALFGLMETLGGALLDDLEGEPLERISAVGLLDDAEQAGSLPAPMLSPQEQAFEPATTSAEFACDELPLPLTAVEGDVGDRRRWRRLGIGVAAAKLGVSSEQERAHLLWAKPGIGIATHRHVGREVVLVLKGAFWDDGVRFGPGDVALSEDGSVHSPRIGDNDECLCLAVTEAPVHFTGIAGFALNRFCRF
ncbi:MAG: cupin domain-containing protein [Geminicoccaceae bacterium]